MEEEIGDQEKSASQAQKLEVEWCKDRSTELFFAAPSLGILILQAAVKLLHLLVPQLLPVGYLGPFMGAS
jgi:hypothetical protein